MFINILIKYGSIVLIELFSQKITNEKGVFNN